MTGMHWVLAAVHPGWVVFIVVAIIALLLAFSWYRIVPANAAHVVIRRGATRVFSPHKEQSAHGKAAYFEIPRWIPHFGVRVHAMPLSMLEINVKDFLAFDRDRVRFECDIVAYMVVEDAMKAAKRFPAGLNELKDQVFKIIKATTRDTTTKLTIREIINDRPAIARRVHEYLEPEVVKWGMSLQACELVNLQDPKDGKSTAIHDISSIAEVQINSEARQKNAEQIKQARLKEAEAEQAAATRELERDEMVGVRTQKRDQEIAREQQAAQEEKMKVMRVQQVRQAEIQRDAAIESAEGDKQAVIRRKTGEAEGVRAVGYAEADAKSKLADALKKINEAALDVRRIEKDEKIGVTAAQALQKADIKFINAGQPNSLLDLFTPSGGASIGGMIAGLEATNPEAYGDILGFIRKRTGRGSGEDRPSRPAKSGK
ncbi:MAG TPA: SPFH domain-containing protein [Planctomycetota bacterium]|nr:SPFH domain-containing protein [Planctomycetota bacterium]